MPLPTTRPSSNLVWSIACASLGVASVLVWLLDLSAPLAWQADSWTYRPWVLWTASLAHLSLAHLFGNLAALAVLAVLGAYLQAGPAAVAAWLISWPLSTAALWFWPEVTGYSGLSGVLCAALGVLWRHAARQPAQGAVSWLLLATMGAKLLIEQAWVHPIGYDPHWGFNVVYAAHLAGFASGAACGWVAARMSRRGEQQ